MTDPATGTTIVYNGEIYNFPELRRSLIQRGAKFTSHCDTEAILKLYLQEGEGGLRALRGMFAFVIWDPRTRTVVAARDGFGIKPLYVWEDRDRVVFASQVRAIAAGVPDPKMHNDALLEFALFGHVVSPETPVFGVHEIAAGSINTWTAEGVRTVLSAKTVRELFEQSGDSHFDEERVAVALKESVAAHMLADVPVGLLLSAGIDSTAVASQLAASNDPRLIASFTIGFSGGDLGVADETADAGLIAAGLGFPNTIERIGPDEIEEELSAYFEQMDQPTVDAVNTFFASRLVRKAKLKVALVGTGGDELFGGYATYSRTPLLLSKIGRVGVVLAQLAAAIGLGQDRFNTEKLGWMRQAGGTIAGAYLVQRGLTPPEGAARAYGCDSAQVKNVFDRVHDTLHDEISGIGDAWSTVSYLETRFYLMPRLLRDSDWAGMAHSVEIRTPLVDWDLWRAVRPLVAAAQAGDIVPKRQLVRAALSPKCEFQISAGKRGFGNPYRQLALLSDANATPRGNPRSAWQQLWAKSVVENWSKSLGGHYSAAKVA